MTEKFSRILWLSLLALILVLGYLWVTFFPKEPGTRTSSNSTALPEVYKLSLGHDHVTSSPHHQAALKFAELVETRSNGRVQITVYPRQQLGTGHQMVEQLREGSLPIALLPTARLTGIAPIMQYIDLPFLFPSREDAYELLAGEIGKLLFDKLEPLGIIGCAFWDSGFKQLTANKLIRTPADYEGLKVRVMKSPIIRAQFEAYGAQAIPIDFQQLYQALKDGVVDAQENPLIGIAEMKLYQVQSHLTLSNHAYLTYLFMCSKKALEQLPEDIRALIIATAKEVTLYERQLLRAMEKGYLEAITDAGIEIHTLTEVERQAFQQSTHHIRKEFRERINREIIDRTETLLTLKHGPGEDLAIGLNADLSLSAAMIGVAIKRGMELAVAELNEAGGVLGRKLRIITLDHAGISARGIANVNKLATINNLVAIMGGLHSSIGLAELPAIHEHNLIYLSPFANATELVENGYQPNYVFRASPSTEETCKFLVDEALKKSTQLALLLENNEWGRSNHKYMQQRLSNYGLSPAIVEWMNVEQKDISAQIAAIIDNKPGAILLAVNPSASVTAVKNLTASNPDIPVFSQMGVASFAFWQKTRKELEKLELHFNQTFTFLSKQNTQARKLAKQYSKAYGSDASQHGIQVPMAVAQAYDLIHLLALAIDKAQTLERSAIRNSLETLESYQGLIKNYHPPFTPLRHDALSKEDIFLARFDRQGNIVPVVNR